jgi:hypothetical protein
MKLKLSILVSILSLLALVNTFGTTHSKAALNWKTYENKKFGYSFEYPAHCNIGPLPGECKQNPPEELSEDCLCFLNGEDPNNVYLQTFQGDQSQGLTLSSISIRHSETSPAFNPPPDADLVTWVEKNFSQMYIGTPEKANIEIDGIPALLISVPPTPSSYSYQDVLFINHDRLFLITMSNFYNKENQALYNHMLSTFSWVEKK